MRSKRFGDGRSRSMRRLLWGLAALACLVSAVVRAAPADADASIRHGAPISETARLAL